MRAHLLISLALLAGACTGHGHPEVLPRPSAANSDLVRLSVSVNCGLCYACSPNGVLLVLRPDGTARIAQKTSGCLSSTRWTTYRPYDEAVVDAPTVDHLLDELRAVGALSRAGRYNPPGNDALSYNFYAQLHDGRGFSTVVAGYPGTRCGNGTETLDPPLCRRLLALQPLVMSLVPAGSPHVIARHAWRPPYLEVVAYRRGSRPGDAAHAPRLPVSTDFLRGEPKFRCSMVTGPDVDTLIRVVGPKDSETQWSNGGAVVTVQLTGYETAAEVCQNYATS